MTRDDHDLLIPEKHDAHVLAYRKHCLFRGQRKPAENIAGDVPANLQAADDLLHQYAQWCWASGGSSKPETLDRMYVRERDFEAAKRRRSARDMVMRLADAMRVQRAMTRVPDQERVVLALLYVWPWKAPAELRRREIPPRLSRERHLLGLRCFWNVHGVLLMAGQ